MTVQQTEIPSADGVNREKEKDQRNDPGKIMRDEKMRCVWVTYCMIKLYLYAWPVPASTSIGLMISPQPEMEFLNGFLVEVSGFLP
jgi:hypothetical protein